MVKVLDANDYGEGTETLALRKELGPGSDDGSKMVDQVCVDWVTGFEGVIVDINGEKCMTDVEAIVGSGEVARARDTIVFCEVYRKDRGDINGGVNICPWIGSR
ncbi:Gmp Reductase 2, partial [Manis pentadactyla]